MVTVRVLGYYYHGLTSWGEEQYSTYSFELYPNNTARNNSFFHDTSLEYGKVSGFSRSHQFFNVKVSLAKAKKMALVLARHS